MNRSSTSKLALTLRRLVCRAKGHQPVLDNRPRLLRLDDSWPPRHTDGLPPGRGVRCARCGMRGVAQGLPTWGPLKEAPDVGIELQRKPPMWESSKR